MNRKSPLIESFTKTTITSLLILASIPIQSPISSNDRILGDESITFGGYSAVKKYSDTCDGYDMEKDVFYTDATFKLEFERTKDNDNWARSSIETYIATKETGEVNTVAQKAIIRIAPVAICAVLSLISFFVCLFWFSCKCLCNILCCCCKDKDFKKSKGCLEKGWFKFVVIISNLLIMGAIILAGIYWMAYIISAMIALQKTDCSISHTVEDMNKGVRIAATDNGQAEIQFAGLEGLKYMLSDINNKIGNLPSATSITDINLDTKSQDLKDSLPVFYKKYKDSTTDSAIVTGKKVRPTSVTSLTEQINEPIGTEVEVLTTAATTVHEGAKAAESISDQIDTARSAITGFVEKIDGFQLQIQNFQNNANDNVRTNERVAIGRVVLSIITIVVLGIFVFYIVLMICSYTGCCYSLSVLLQAILVVLIMFISFLLCSLALGMTSIAVASSNGCYFAGQILQNETLANQIFALIDSPDMNKYYTLCIAEGGSGDLKQLLPTEQLDKLKEMESMFNGFKINLTQLNVTDGAELKSPTIDGYKTLFLKKWLDWSIPDYAEVVEDSPEKALLLINQQVSCIPNSPNEFVLNAGNCTKTPVSAIPDAETFRTTADYCLVASNLGYKTMTNRYSSTATTCAIPAHATYNQLRVCTDQHKALLDGMILDLGLGPENKAKAIYTGLLDAADKINEFQIALKSILEMVFNTDDLFALFNCQILRIELRNNIGNICYRFVDNFSKQAFAFMFIGPLFMLMGCCVCCSYLQGNSGNYKKKDKKKDKERKDQYEEPKEAKHAPPKPINVAQHEWDDKIEYSDEYVMKNDTIKEPVPSNNLNQGYR